MDLRQLRGIEIAKQKQVRKTKDGYLVKSQSGAGYYRVGEDFSCTCPDAEFHNATCKHAYAVRYYLKTELDTPQGVKVVEKRLTYKQAWSAYNKSQNEEVRLFDELLRDLVQEIEEPEQQGAGRKRLSLREQVFCSVQKVYSQLSSRRAHSLYKNAQERQQIEKAPHFNAVNKVLNRPELTPILHQLVAVSASPLKAVETDFAVDSTGFQTTRFNDWCEVMHGLQRDRKWVKAHFCTGVKTNVVSAVEITREDGADSPQFPMLVEKTVKGFEVKEISADKAYSSRENYEVVAEVGGQAFVPFRSNATGKSKGSLLWRKMFHYFQFNQQEFYQHYHKRSNAESTVNMIKAKFGDTLKSKNHISQINELLCKIIAHNLVVIIHEINELGITAKFN
jgi:transposase